MKYNVWETKMDKECKGLVYNMVINSYGFHYFHDYYFHYISFHYDYYLYYINFMIIFIKHYKM
jgi:hypothetical protein